MATVTNAGTADLGSYFDNLSNLTNNNPYYIRVPTQINLGGPYFDGTGFTFDATGRPTGGTIIQVSTTSTLGARGVVLPGFKISGIQVPLTTLYAAAVQGTSATLVPGLLSGDDTFVVQRPTSTLYGYDGNDLFRIGLGEGPSVDGGAGVDNVALGRLRSDTPVEVRPGSVLLTETGYNPFTGINYNSQATYTSVDSIRFLDGTLSLDPATVGGQVYILFQTAFGRAPGTGELGYFTDAASRYGLSETASGLLATPEAQARLGGLDGAGFIQAVYRAALGRDADPGGLQFWQGRLATGDAGRAAVLAGIAATDEAKNRFAAAIAPGIFGADPRAVAVDRVYLAATGALPSADNLSFWANTDPLLYHNAAGRYNTTVGSLSDLEKQLATNGLSDADFVASLIRNTYGADASDPGAVAYYTQALRNGGTRADVLDAYASSPGIDARVASYITDHGVLHA